MNPLKLLLVVHQFPPASLGGVEIHTFQLARELQKRGHEVRVLYPEFDTSRSRGTVSNGIYEGVRTERIHLQPHTDLILEFKNEKAGAAFEAHVRSLGVDIVHFQHLIGFSALAPALCARLGIPSVMTVHDAWLFCQQGHLIRANGNFCAEGPVTIDQCVHCLVGRFPGIPLSDQLPQLFYGLALRRQVLQKSTESLDAITVCSRFMHERLQAHGIRHPNIVLSPLGLHPFKPEPFRPRRNRVRFTFLGTIYFTKGLDILVKAFNRLPEGKAELNIFGHIIDEDYFRTSMGLSVKGNEVQYRGEYAPEDLPAILAETDIAVIPSRIESFSIVARECLHAGVPVIGPDAGGVSEIIREGENGLIFRSGDEKDLAEKLHRIILHPEEVETLRKGIQPVRTISEEVDDMELIYAKIYRSQGDLRRAQGGQTA